MTLVEFTLRGEKQSLNDQLLYEPNTGELPRATQAIKGTKFEGRSGRWPSGNTFLLKRGWSFM